MSINHQWWPMAATACKGAPALTSLIQRLCGPDDGWRVANSLLADMPIQFSDKATDIHTIRSVLVDEMQMMPVPQQQAQVLETRIIIACVPDLEYLQAWCRKTRVSQGCAMRRNNSFCVRKNLHLLRVT
jgi:hypothetical protein